MPSLKLACTSPGVAEIFRSIQGEGPNSGRLRTFVRLSGCNLQCAWCDTPYTWNWHGTPWPHVADGPDAPSKFDPARESVELSVDEVAERVAQLPAEGVVITGGEPLVQMRALTALIERLREQAPSRLVEIETNGTLAPSAALAGLVDLFMVSPKLENAGNRPGAAIRARALAAFAELPTAAFKLVAATPDDVNEAARLAATLGIEPTRVYIMPLGTDSGTLNRIGASIIGAVIDNGFNYSDRLHVHLFGDTRGT